jgi:hypothetical protein
MICDEPIVESSPVVKEPNPRLARPWHHQLGIISASCVWKEGLWCIWPSFKKEGVKVCQPWNGASCFRVINDSGVRVKSLCTLRRHVREWWCSYIHSLHRQRLRVNSKLRALAAVHPEKTLGTHWIWGWVAAQGVSFCADKFVRAFGVQWCQVVKFVITGKRLE